MPRPLGHSGIAVEYEPLSSSSDEQRFSTDLSGASAKPLPAGDSRGIGRTSRGYSVLALRDVGESAQYRRRENEEQPHARYLYSEKPSPWSAPRTPAYSSNRTRAGLADLILVHHPCARSKRLVGGVYEAARSSTFSSSLSSCVASSINRAARPILYGTTVTTTFLRGRILRARVRTYIHTHSRL